MVGGDLSTLQQQADINLQQQIGCDYVAIVRSDVQTMQRDVSAESAEINEAEKLLSTMTPAVARQAGGDVAKLRTEVAASRADLNGKIEQANAAVHNAEVNVHEPLFAQIAREYDCATIDLALHGILESGAEGG